MNWFCVQVGAGVLTRAHQCKKFPYKGKPHQTGRIQLPSRQFLLWMVRLGGHPEGLISQSLLSCILNAAVNPGLLLQCLYNFRKIYSKLPKL